MVLLIGQTEGGAVCAGLAPDTNLTECGTGGT